MPAPFFPGVVLGGVTFLALYAWPFLERWCGGDHLAHHLLDRPRDHPVRMGVGVLALTFFGVLVVTAGDDIIARLLRVPVYDVLDVLRVLVLVLPVLAGALAFLLARALRGGEAKRLGELTRADLRAARQRTGGGDTGSAADEPGPHRAAQVGRRRVGRLAAGGGPPAATCPTARHGWGRADAAVHAERFEPGSGYAERDVVSRHAERTRRSDET